MSNTQRREGHANLDLIARKKKGQKIERLLPRARASGDRMLEVGTGAGGIAHYFANDARTVYDVDAVDVVDKRQVFEGYKFQEVHSTELPFEDGTFDVVISNHVIEHVGNHAAQLHHLSEIKRVLKVSGTLYLAVPNRWMLIEPHFRVPLLSWLPRGLRTSYLRLWQPGKHYDCEPLRLPEILELAKASGFFAEVVSISAFRLLMEIESPGGWVPKTIALIPDALLRRIVWFFPTHVVLMRPCRGPAD